MMECDCCRHSCCCVADDEETDFASDSGRVRRTHSQKQFATLATVQAILGAMSLLSGAATICLAIPNPAMPFMSFFPFANGVMILIAWCFLRTAVRANICYDVPSRVRKNIALHFALNISCLLLSAASVGLSAWGLVVCFRAGSNVDDNSVTAATITTMGDSDDRRKCQPARGAKTAFVFADAMLASGLCSACVAGCLLFCRHARRLGFVGRSRRLERQVIALRDMAGRRYNNQVSV